MKVITICGSLKFKNAIASVNLDFTNISKINDTSEETNILMNMI